MRKSAANSNPKRVITYGFVRLQCQSRTDRKKLYLRSRLSPQLPVGTTICTQVNTRTWMTDESRLTQPSCRLGGPVISIYAQGKVAKFLRRPIARNGHHFELLQNIFDVPNWASVSNIYTASVWISLQMGWKTYDDTRKDQVLRPADC